MDEYLARGRTIVRNQTSLPWTSAHWRQVWRMALQLLVILLSGGFSDCEAGDRRNVISRWDSKDRGRIVFISGISLGLPHYTVGVMELSSRNVTLLHPPSGNKWRQYLAPKWAPDGTHIYVGVSGPEEGIWTYSLQRGELRRLISWGSNSSRGEPDGLMPVIMNGTRYWYDRPFVSYDDIEMDVDPLSQAITVARFYAFFNGPPGYHIELDTLNEPVWVKARFNSHDIETDSAGEFMDIIRFDSIGNVDRLREHSWSRTHGMSLSHSGGQTALTSRSRFKLSKVGNETSMVHTPAKVIVTSLSSDSSISPRFPEPYIESIYPAFSPDGKYLAFIATENLVHGSTAVVVNPSNDFNSNAYVFKLDGWLPRRICWSPDGEWLLVAARPVRVSLEVYDLLAIEVSSGEFFEIPRPYLVNGESYPEIHVEEGIDWTE